MPVNRVHNISQLPSHNHYQTRTKTRQGEDKDKTKQHTLAQALSLSLLVSLSLSPVCLSLLSLRLSLRPRRPPFSLSSPTLESAAFFAAAASLSAFSPFAFIISSCISSFFSFRMAFWDGLPLRKHKRAEIACRSKPQRVSYDARAKEVTVKKQRDSIHPIYNLI